MEPIHNIFDCPAFSTTPRQKADPAPACVRAPASIIALLTSKTAARIDPGNLPCSQLIWMKLSRCEIANGDWSFQRGSTASCIHFNQVETQMTHFAYKFKLLWAEGVRFEEQSLSHKLTSFDYEVEFSANGVLYAQPLWTILPKSCPGDTGRDGSTSNQTEHDTLCLNRTYASN